MQLFETTWRDGYKCFERVFDTSLNRSISREIDTNTEWYEESSRGHYEYVLDPTIKLDRKLGRAKDSQGHYGVTNPLQRNIRDNYWGKNNYNLKPRIIDVDIETRSGVNSKGFPKPDRASEQVTLIQVFDRTTETMIVIGLRDWKHEKDFNYPFTVKYIKVDDEYALFDTYIKIFQKIDPLIIYAWNGGGFDYPYLYNRMKNLGLDPNDLSNYGNCTLNQHEFMNMIEFKFSAPGHHYIDLKDVYQKFTFHPMTSYSLDAVAEFDLGRNKVDHSEYAAFDDFYTGKYIIPDNPTEEQKNSKIYQEAIKGNWDEVRELAHSEFVHYGCTDTFLVTEIDKARNFTTLLLMIAEKMGITVGAAMGTVGPWSTYLSNRLIAESKVMPPRQEHDSPSVVGGYVRDPNKGKHRWIMSTDVNSMYPLLGMVGFNMSSETFIKKANLPPELRDIVLAYFNDQDQAARFNIPDNVWNKTTELLQQHNIALGINGAAFSRDQVGIIPLLVQDIYNSRKKAKQTQFKYEQRAVLIDAIISEKSK